MSLKDTSVFKILTGGDTLQYNKKQQGDSASVGFQYDGAVIVACKNPINSDNPAAVNRRRISVNFKTEYEAEGIMTKATNQPQIDHAQCPNTLRFLNEALGGDEQQIRAVQAFMKCAITGTAYKYQKYLEISGLGGSGRGTVIRLLQSIIGDDKVRLTNLKSLERSRHETAEINGKRLVIIDDAENYSGDTSVFKRLTGGDTLQYNDKQQVDSASVGFKYDGAVIVACNNPINSDNPAALNRRRISVHFKTELEPTRDIDAEIRAELPGVVNWAMSITDDEVGGIMTTATNQPQIDHAWISDTDNADELSEFVIDNLHETGIKVIWKYRAALRLIKLAGEGSRYDCAKSRMFIKKIKRQLDVNNIGQENDLDVAVFPLARLIQEFTAYYEQQGLFHELLERHESLVLDLSNPWDLSEATTLIQLCQEIVNTHNRLTQHTKCECGATYLSSNFTECPKCGHDQFPF